VTASRFTRARARACKALAIACSLIAVSASLASADAVVLLPPSGDGSLRAAQQRAHDGLQDVLVDEGHRVLTHAETSVEAQTEEARGCKAVACAKLLVHEVGATLALGVSVWASDVDQAVFVTLVDERGNRFPARVLARDGDVVAAAKLALQDARALMKLGPGPWLRVHGKPDGAEVVLGGNVIGETPLRTKVASGRYVLEVRKAGHKTFVQSVDVPPGSSRQVEVEVSLQARAAPGENVALTAVDQANAPEPGERDATWSFVLGGVLAAIGAGALAYGIVNATAVRDCEERDAAGRCESEVKLGPAVTIPLIGGGVALAGSLVMFIVQPIETRGETSGAMLTARGRL
jgi:hypothetical protein